MATWLENDDELGPVDPEMGASRSNPDADAAMRRFLAAKTGLLMQPVDPIVNPLSKGQKWRFRLPAILSAAAAVLAVLLVGVWRYSEPVSPERSLMWKTVSIPNGKKATVTLPDSTVVHLNSGSTLRYPEKFTDSIRLVTLEGEAFFHVAKDASHPFIVNSIHYTQIRVLGTAFNVRAYQRDREVEVSVQEGKVHFGNMEYRISPAILTAGQSATYLADTYRMQHLQSNRRADAWAWKDGRLAFSSEPLSDVGAKLERWYGVQIEIREKRLAGMRYSGAYTNPNLYQLLENMQFVLGFRYEVDRRHQRITIY